MEERDDVAADHRRRPSVSDLTGGEKRRRRTPSVRDLTGGEETARPGAVASTQGMSRQTRCQSLSVSDPSDR